MHLLQSPYFSVHYIVLYIIGEIHCFHYQMQFSVEVKVPFTNLVNVLSSFGKAVVPGFAEVSSTRWRADPEWTAAISF